MLELGRMLTDADLQYLIRVAAPGSTNKSAFVRALREDGDILAGMLRDPRMANHLLTQPERVVTASPRLFFAVLLVRIRAELEQTTYTVEQEDRHLMLVFDSREVAGLMHRGDIMAYLVGMLVSFLKIRTQSQVVRLRRGTWRRIEYNDMDLRSLIALGERAQPEAVFALARRIGDVCLFQSSFFPSAGGLPQRQPAAPGEMRGKLTEIGRHYYRVASLRSEARELDVADALEELALRFDVAVKPLALMARRYLDRLKERVFTV